VLSKADEVPAGPEADTFSLPSFEARRGISQTVTVFRPGTRLLIAAWQPLPAVSSALTAASKAIFLNMSTTSWTPRL